MIEVIDLHKSLNGVPVLKGINFKVEKGEILALIGKSGHGKSVLLKHIVGIMKPDRGNILIDGEDITKSRGTALERLRRRSGFLFQGGALFDSLDVEGNVMFPLNMFTTQPLSEKLDRVNFVLKRVNLENAGKLMPSELSGGMRKRVAIARAIAMNPQYLFCDEPNSGLDPQTSGVIDHLIQEITLEYNITTIVNTHDMNSVLSIGDSVAFIYKGKLWWRGDKETILHSTNQELNEFVFGTELTSRLKQ